VIEQPCQRRPPHLLGVLVVGEVGGVGPQQIVHAVATWTGRPDQVRPDQEIQKVLGLLKAGVGQGGCGVEVQVGAGVQPDQPERPRRLGRQV